MLQKQEPDALPVVLFALRGTAASRNLAFFG